MANDNTMINIILIIVVIIFLVALGIAAYNIYNTNNNNTTDDPPADTPPNNNNTVGDTTNNNANNVSKPVYVKPSNDSIISLDISNDHYVEYLKSYESNSVEPNSLLRQYNEECELSDEFPVDEVSGSLHTDSRGSTIILGDVENVDVSVYDNNKLLSDSYIPNENLHPFSSDFSSLNPSEQKYFNRRHHKLPSTTKKF